MIIVNACYQRWVRSAGRRVVITTNRQGIRLYGVSWEDDHSIIREKLMELRPEGDWTIQGYCLIKEEGK